MKIKNSIIIAIIFLIIIFLVKSDYKSIYSKVLTYMQDSIDNTSSVYKSDYKNKVEKAMNTIGEDVKIATKVEAPGALIVPDDLLSYSIKNINLSSKNVIEITNKYRKENGNLSPLIENTKLNFSAEKKLQDMFVKGYFEHVSPGGIGVGDLGNEVGYEYILIGENLAMGNFKDDQALVDAWMASPGHKANILHNRYKEIGVSVGKGSYNGKTIWMAVQHFALPKSACPVISEVLRGMIDFDQDKIKRMESELASKRAKIESGVVSEGLTTNGQIESYNLMVNEYNKIILDIKEKINKYNEQVKDFNSCIEGI